MAQETLALLPPELRGVLIAKYIDDTPLAEIAACMGSTPGTVAVRLHLGKLALKRVLRTDLQSDAATYGLLTTPQCSWSTTNIWCPYCGKQRMTGLMDRDSGILDLRCVQCAPDSAQALYIKLPRLFDNVKGFKAALTRHLNFSDQMYSDAVTHSDCQCIGCGGPARLTHSHLGDPVNASLQIWCEHCGLVCHASVRGLALYFTVGGCGDLCRKLTFARDVGVVFRRTSHVVATVFQSSGS